MLILGRRIGESIMIKTAHNDLIEVFLCETRGKQAKIGVEAGESVEIDRSEIYIKKEKDKFLSTKV